MAYRIKLPTSALIVVDRTTRGNINPDRQRNTEPETVAAALKRDAFATERGTLEVTVRLADTIATAAALGVPRIDYITSNGPHGSGEFGRAVYAVIPEPWEIE